MRISAVLWCKDEVALLPYAVAQLLRSGVYSVSIMDDGSTDGTAIALDTLHAVLPNVHICPRVKNLQDALSMDGPVFGPIIARDRPDWLLVGDPDEFWIPRTGDLRSLPALRTCDVLVVDRFNAALSSGKIDLGMIDSQAALCNLPLVVERRRMTRAIMAENPDLRWVEHHDPPKVMVRPDMVASFDLGMHDATSASGAELRRGQAGGVLIAHLPFTTFSRFERKIQNIAKVFDRFDADHSGARGWHWRRWLEIAENGELAQEYARQFFPPKTLNQMRAKGRVATANDIFARRMAEAAAHKAQAAET